MHEPLAVATPADTPDVARSVSLAFGGTIEQSQEWLGRIGLENIRVLRREGRAVANLARISKGQYFGGRSVPMVGIAGVAVPPERRGGGLARTLMTGLVRELHQEGVPLSALYASTQALYRQVGYEQAGYRWAARVPVARLSGLGKARRVIVLTPEDHPRVAECYRRFAGCHNGTLDRGDYAWARVKDWRGTRYEGFGVLDDASRLIGYVYLTASRDPVRGRLDIQLSDLAFVTAGAGRQLLSLLSDFEPTADTVTLHGAPMHPVLTLLPQQRYEVTSRDVWLLRVTHVARALEARGYPAGLQTAFTIDLADSVIPEQAGRWRVEIDSGRAKVTRGSDEPSIICEARGLACLYSGLYTPRQAALLGLCEGDDAAMDAAQLAFAGGTPWMTDFF